MQINFFYKMKAKMFINHIPIAYSVWLIVYKFLQRIYNYYVSNSFIKIDKSCLTARSSWRCFKKPFSLNLQVDFFLFL